MSYKVTNDFVDITHKNTLYKKGDTYPKNGFKVNKDRVAFLMQKHNKYKVAFIEEVKDEQPKRKSQKKSSSEDRG
nr:hypothetical protein 11 [Bacillaceae bacterium]